MNRYLPLICLMLLHTLADACSLLMAPIWAELDKSHSMDERALFLVLTVASLSPSLSQAVFGYIRDRQPVRFLLWLGPVIAACCIPLIGIASDVTVLCLLLIIGGIGIGAFHPEAAVAAGEMLPGQRARGLSLFMFGGALGLALGPILSGGIVKRFGLQGLVYVGPPIALLVGLLFLIAQRYQKPERSGRPRTVVSLREMLEGRGWLALLILATCSLRLVPNMAMDKVLSFTLEQRGFDSFMTGLVQSLFLISASVGMLLMAYWFRSGWEKGFIVWCPLAGIPLLLLLGWTSCPQWLLVSLLVPTGLILWGTTPAMVSYAHQQFPNGAGLASAMTMGLAWSIGGMIQAKITSVYVAESIPQQAFHAFIPCLILAAAGAWFLPEPNRETVRRAMPLSDESLMQAQPEPTDA